MILSSKIHDSHCHPLQFYKVTWHVAKARKLENPSEKMMCRCAAVPVYVSSVSEMIFWNQFLIFLWRCGEVSCDDLA